MSKKQEHLIEAARSLFLYHGVRRVSIKEICEKASVSKVTFYRYFTDKGELVKFIRDSLIKEGFSKFDEISVQRISYAEKLDLMTEWRRKFFSGMSPDFIEDVFSMEDLTEMIKERFFRMITDAQKNGDIREEFTPELIWLVNEKMYELSAEGNWKTAVADYGEYQAQLRLLFYHGLLTK